MATYAFAAVSGAFTDPDVGTYTFAGQQGIDRLTVGNTTEHTSQTTTGDGSVLVNAIAGDSGYIDLEMLQTSTLHQYLKNWHNTKIAALKAGDASNWAGAAIRISDSLTGASSILTGVSPSKIPDEPRGNEGVMITWHLPAANVVNS